jgi:cobalamin-dependent methionine synthase I
LLTTTMRNQRSVIEALEKAVLRSHVKVMVGDAPVTRRWAEEIGAGDYAKDAMSAVLLARSLMEQKARSLLAEPASRPHFCVRNATVSTYVGLQPHGRPERRSG